MKGNVFFIFFKLYAIFVPQRLSDHAKTVSFQASPKPSEIIYTTLLNNATIKSLCFEFLLVKYKKNYLITMKKYIYFYLNFKALGIAG